MTGKIIDTVFDNWCASQFDPEIQSAINKALENPTQDTIFQLASITEASAFRAGFREYQKLIHKLLAGDPDI